LVCRFVFCVSKVVVGRGRAGDGRWSLKGHCKRAHNSCRKIKIIGIKRAH